MIHRSLNRECQYRKAKSLPVPLYGCRHIKRTLTREPAAEQLNLVLAALAGREDVILFVESLEIPPTQADMLHQLAEHVQIAATVEDSNRRNRIMRLLWRFQSTLELKPLTRAEVRAWVTQWLEANPLDFESPRVREAFLSAVARDSNGVPAAVEGMLSAAAQDREVTRARVTGYRHEAAVTYLDMTPMLVIAVAAFTALRYIGRGARLQELMVLAGVGSSLFWMVVFFARRMGVGSSVPLVGWPGPIDGRPWPRGASDERTSDPISNTRYNKPILSVVFAPFRSRSGPPEVQAAHLRQDRRLWPLLRLVWVGPQSGSVLSGEKPVAVAPHAFSGRSGAIAAQCGESLNDWGQAGGNSTR